ncbi:TPA: hypothetical protein ACGIK9_002920 [Acinetobacter baumannii]|uniref:hypothetical protein n=1 Tax=Acinetobacter baumannii TaxID=470 RepID=UPI00338F01DF
MASDFVKPLDHRKSELQRLVVAVNEFYKHDGDDVTYAHGIEVRTKTPVRIRMSSVEELKANTTKLKGSHTNITDQDIEKLVRGKRSRQSQERLSNNDSNGIRGQDFYPDRARLLVFDKCKLQEKENLGNYMAFSADRVNVMSNDINSQVIHGLTTVTVRPYMKDGERHYGATAIVLDQAHRLSSPDALKLDTNEQKSAVIIQNLQTLISALKNSSDSQNTIMPFARLNIRENQSQKVIASNQLLPSLVNAYHEDVVQNDKPDTMQQHKGTDKEVEKTAINYKVAASPQDSIAELVNCNDFTTRNFLEKFGSNATLSQMTNDAEMRSAFRDVLKQDTARVIIAALTGNNSPAIVTSQSLSPNDYKNLLNLSYGLKNGHYSVELFSGQQFNLGSRYAETFIPSYLNDISPKSGFREIKPDAVKVDLRNGIGIDGVDQPARPARTPNGKYKLDYDFVLNCDPNAIDYVTSYAKPVFTPAYVAIQPLSKLATDNLIAVNVETQELGRFQVMQKAMSMSDLTVEFVNQHATKVHRPANLNEFMYDKLMNVQELYTEQRQEMERKRESQNDIMAPKLPNLNETVKLQQNQNKVKDELTENSYSGPSNSF